MQDIAPKKKKAKHVRDEGKKKKSTKHTKKGKKSGGRKKQKATDSRSASSSSSSSSSDDNEMDVHVPSMVGDDIEKEWAAYVKTVKTPNARKRANSATSKTDANTANSNNNNSEDNDSDTVKPSKSKKPRTTKKKKTDIMAKCKETNDMMRNDTELNMSELLGNTARHHQQKAHAIHVMPSREHQNVETLALGKRAGSKDAMLLDSDICMQIKRRNFQRNRNSVALPLDELAENGFLAVNNECIDEVLRYVSSEFNDDIAYLASKRVTSSPAQRAPGGDKASAASRGGGGGGSDPKDLSVKKLNFPFGNAYKSFGYGRRTSKGQSFRIKALRNSVRLQRFLKFYEDDELEEETDFHQLPDDFKMFREYIAKNKARYKRKDEVLCHSGTLTPKVSQESVPLHHILRYLQPPTGADDEQLCSNGKDCVSNTYSPDRNVCYISQAFYTPLEEQACRLHPFLKHRVFENRAAVIDREPENSDEDDDEEENPLIGNKHRLCYYCLTRLWTFQAAWNIRHEVVPEKPMNYFTVQCEQGQYSKHCMLKMEENGKSTGIFGHVPRFSRNNKRIVPVMRTVSSGNKFHAVYRAKLDETGMDF